MPLSHAVETVRGILIGRLDDTLEDLETIALEVAGDDVPDLGVRQTLAIRFIQAVQLRLFPEEFSDGPEYTPDPAGRMDDVPVNRVGLVPALPTVAILAKHLLAGQQSPAAALTIPSGEKVLTKGDLIVLGERMERRAAKER